jgi:hypothetical protein
MNKLKGGTTLSHKERKVYVESNLALNEIFNRVQSGELDICVKGKSKAKKYDPNISFGFNANKKENKNDT